MDQRRAEVAYFPFNLWDFVDFLLFVISTACPVQQPYLVVGVPACVPDLAPKGKVAAWDAVGGLLLRSYRAHDFGGKLRGHALVGIDEEYPGGRYEIERAVTLRSEVRELRNFNASCDLARNR